MPRRDTHGILSNAAEDLRPPRCGGDDPRTSGRLHGAAKDAGKVRQRRRVHGHRMVPHALRYLRYAPPRPVGVRAQGPEPGVAPPDGPAPAAPASTPAVSLMR